MTCFHIIGRTKEGTCLTISNRGYGLETGASLTPGVPARNFLDTKKKGFASGIFREKYENIIFFNWLDND
jgi:hypothetical protein